MSFPDTDTTKTGFDAAEVRQIDPDPRIAELEERREELAAQLGASLYEATKSDAALRTGREELYDAIEMIDEALARIQAEAEEAKAAEAVAASDTEPETEPEPEQEQEPEQETGPAETPANGTDSDPAPDTALVCAACGAPMEESFLFCRSCGAKKGSTAPKQNGQTGANQAPQLQPSMTTVLQQPASDVRVCAVCGKPMEAEHRFCMSCGAKNGPTSSQSSGPLGAMPASASPDHTTILSFDNALLCSVCGAALEPGNRFCAVCGSKV